jgi:hypothetical protein
MCSDNAGYVFGAGGGHAVDLNATSKFNLRTETKGTNPGGPGFAASDSATAFAPDRNRSFTTGDGVSNMFRFTASTEAYATLGGGQAGHACQVSGENKGLYWSTENGNRSINFSTEAQATTSFAGGAHGQQKGLSAKTGFGYGGNEGTYNGGFNYRKINITNETSSNITKMLPDSGEENHAMSQDRGYILGMYNGLQNNQCARLIYATDERAALGTTILGSGPPPSGVHSGASSGHCFWRD